MVPTTEILRALVSEGYLTETNIEAASPIITDALRDDAVETRAEILSDEAQQEQMITGARQYAAHDALVRDKEGLNIDSSIIRDAIGKEKQDKSALRHTDKMITTACKTAAKNLAHAKLIDKSHVKEVAGLIKNTWIANSY